MTEISGQYDPKFQSVVDAFEFNFKTRSEIGASCSLSVDGETVVDIWGGRRVGEDGPDGKWKRDTLSLVFSCTKAATALCLHRLIDRGDVELDAPVSRYWPEFVAHDKDQITVRMLLNHSSALPALRASVKAGGYLDFDYMAQRLAHEPPFWKPGTDNGYHMISFGWTVGEVVRRVSGKSLGTFFKDEIANPLDLDFFIGLPDSEFHRVSKMIPYAPSQDDVPTDFVKALMSDPTSIQFLALFNSGGFVFDSAEAWKAEIGGGGGISNARALQKMYANLIGAQALLSAERIEDMRHLSASTSNDRTLLIPTRFGQGFMLSMDNRHLTGQGNSAIIGAKAFGHVGMGGSVGFGDPEFGLAFGYTMNLMGGGILLNERGQSLVDAAYTALGCNQVVDGGWARTSQAGV